MARAARPRREPTRSGDGDVCANSADVVNMSECPKAPKTRDRARVRRAPNAHQRTTRNEIRRRNNATRRRTGHSTHRDDATRRRDAMGADAIAALTPGGVNKIRQSAGATDVCVQARARRDDDAMTANADGCAFKRDRASRRGRRRARSRGATTRARTDGWSFIARRCSTLRARTRRTGARATR